MNDFQLTDNDHQPLDKSTLVARVVAIPEARVAALIERCSADGSIIGHDGHQLGGLGVAARLVFDDGVAAHHADGVRDVLAGIDIDGTKARTGQDWSGQAEPVVLGALPFVPTTPAEMFVPEIALFAGPKADARAVLVGKAARVAELSDTLSSDAFGTSPRRPTLPDAFELTSIRSHRQFCDTIEQALAEIATGRLSKVVLAREVLVRANRPFGQADLLSRLRALYPSCATFAIEGFLGASPELLVRREGDVVHSQPLAGTAPRTGDPEEDAKRATALFSSPKERAEHRYVVDAIASALSPYAARLSVPDQPHLLELRNVVHLASMIEAQLHARGPHELPNALELALALHPTPAVGGVPRDQALQFLASHEQLSRDLYAGPIGYLGASGDGEFYVGIRSAMIDGDRARLIAGVGIVEGSDPTEELAETQLKLQALLSAAVRP